VFACLHLSYHLATSVYRGYFLLILYYCCLLFSPIPLGFRRCVDGVVSVGAGVAVAVASAAAVVDVVHFILLLFLANPLLGL
jgi:hypothetical protein